MEKELYMNELTRFLEEDQRFFKLYGEKADIPQKDINILKEIATSTRDNISMEPVDDPNIKKILSGLDQLIFAAGNVDILQMKEEHKALEAIKSEYDYERERGDKVKNIFQTDLREIELHMAKINMLQDLVNFELKKNNYVSQIILDVLDVQHCKLVNRTIVQEKFEMKEVIPEKDEMVEKNDHKTADHPVTLEQTKLPQQPYKANVYMKNTFGRKQTPKIIYGDSPESIISTLQGWNAGRMEEMKFCTCYVAKLEEDSGKYTNLAKYDVETGADITPIYLDIPHMRREEFLKVVGQIKKDGARYNPIEKKFFITKQLDFSRFSRYLPTSGIQTKSINPTNVIDIRSQNRKPDMIEYHGKKYEPLQYNVLEIAINQNFTKEQIALLERPELSSDRMNEIRFAISDGLTPTQIAQFATPSHEQWQMDFCRTGMQHGLQYGDLKDIINPDNYSREQWGERRNQLAQIIKAKEKEMNVHSVSNQRQTTPQSRNSGKISVMSKISQNKAKLGNGKTDVSGQSKEVRESLEK